MAPSKSNGKTRSGKRKQGNVNTSHSDLSLARKPHSVSSNQNSAKNDTPTTAKLTTSAPISTAILSNNAQPGSAGVYLPDSNNNPIQPPPKAIIAVQPHDYEVHSAMTESHVGPTVCRITLNQFTQRDIFPFIKFFQRPSEDPDLQFSTESKSICQHTFDRCRMNHRLFPKETWIQCRKIICQRVTALRNDKNTAVQKAYYGKSLNDILFPFIFAHIIKITVWSVIMKKRRMVATKILSSPQLFSG